MKKRKRENPGLIRTEKKQRRIPQSNVLNALCIFFLFLAQNLYSDVSDLPYWDQISPLIKEELLEAQDSNAILTLVLNNQSQVPVLFTASAINMLSDRGASEVIPKMLLALNEERGFEVMRSRIHLYLLENRSDAAQRLSNVMYEIFSNFRTYTDAVQISMVLGHSNLARSRLNEYLNNNVQQNPVDYARSIFLVARLFIAEGNRESAYTLLSKYFEESHGENVNSPYIIESAFLLNEIIANDPNHIDLQRRISRFVSQKVPSYSFPDQRILAHTE